MKTAASGKRLLAGLLIVSLAVGLGAAHSLPAQDANARLIQGIDAAVQARENNLLGYTVTEHYVVFRNHNEQHPAAEMVVKTSFQKNVGKNFSVQSLTGSLVMRKMLEAVLDTETRMTQPANRSTAVITSANYEMSVKGAEMVDGRACIAVAIKPRRTSPYLFSGTIWVDAGNEAIVQLDGVTSKSPSVLTGPSQVFRRYTTMDGLPMATHAQAVSSSTLLGQTVIKIDYTGYQIQTGSK